MHSDATVMEEGKKKPEIVMYYNKTKAGVDTMDQMARTYTCKRQTRRWPLTLFFNLLDVAAINAYILFLELNPTYNTWRNDLRRLFLKDLAKELLMPHMLKRSETTQHRHVKEAMKLCGVELANPVVPTEKLKKRIRCAECPPNADKKTQTVCLKCKKPICGAHTVSICHQCI